MVPGGTIWGTTWFEVRGRIDRESVKGRAVELVVDLGWKRHRGPGFQAEGLCYRPDGSVIKAVNPDNCWIPLIDANGVANVELDDPVVLRYMSRPHRIHWSKLTCHSRR